MEKTDSLNSLELVRNNSIDQTRMERKTLCLYDIPLFSSVKTHYISALEKHSQTNNFTNQNKK